MSGLQRIPARHAVALWGAAPIPETRLDFNVAVQALEDAVKKARAERPEVRETALALDINALDARLTRESARRKIDGFAHVISPGLAGTLCRKAPIASRSFIKVDWARCRRFWRRLRAVVEQYRAP